MNEEFDRFQRRLFQRVKSMSQRQFNEMMTNIFNEYYGIADKHYKEAMNIVLKPYQRKAVEDKALEIKETWDGIF